MHRIPVHSLCCLPACLPACLHACICRSDAHSSHTHACLHAHIYMAGTTSTTADIAYCLYPLLRLCTYIYHAPTQVNTLETHTFFFQIMGPLLKLN